MAVDEGRDAQDFAIRAHEGASAVAGHDLVVRLKAVRPNPLDEALALGRDPAAKAVPIHDNHIAGVRQAVACFERLDGAADDLKPRQIPVGGHGERTKVKRRAIQPPRAWRSRAAHHMLICHKVGFPIHREQESRSRPLIALNDDQLVLDGAETDRKRGFLALGGRGVVGGRLRGRIPHEETDHKPDAGDRHHDQGGQGDPQPLVQRWFRHGSVQAEPLRQGWQGRAIEIAALLEILRHPAWRARRHRVFKRPRGIPKRGVFHIEPVGLVLGHEIQRTQHVELHALLKLPGGKRPFDNAVSINPPHAHPPPR